MLAIIAGRGGCTPYAVRTYLAASLSSYWSASAGAIYPLLRNLAERGLVEVDESAFGRRRKRLYSLTAAGRRAVRRWLDAPLPRSVVAHTYDPVRTRVFFLGELGPAGRRAFLDAAVKQTREVLDRFRAEGEEMHAELPEWELAGRDGAIRELEARLARLTEVRRGLRGP